jgi:3-dehydroquinate dehydratase-2
VKRAPARRSPGANAPLRVRCISGPNLQLLGTREPTIYGAETLDAIHARLALRGQALGVTVEAFQTNHEGAICDLVAACGPARVDGLLINAGAYTHTSIAIFDAIVAVGVPCVEVHLSNPDAREAYRRRSRMAPACVGRVAGFRGDSYLLALEGLVGVLRRA